MSALCGNKTESNDIIPSKFRKTKMHKNMIHCSNEGCYSKESQTPISLAVWPHIKLFSSWLFLLPQPCPHQLCTAVHFHCEHTKQEFLVAYCNSISSLAELCRTLTLPKSFHLQKDACLLSSLIYWWLEQEARRGPANPPLYFMARQWRVVAGSTNSWIWMLTRVSWGAFRILMSSSYFHTGDNDLVGFGYIQCLADSNANEEPLLKSITF